MLPAHRAWPAPGSALAAAALLCASALWAARPAQEELVFWHTQGDDRGELLARLIEDYNASGPPMPVQAIYKGSYDDIFRATRANLIAGNPPDLAIAYESMVNEYMKLREVANLDPLLRDPQIGLTQEEIDDFFPAFLQINRYPQFGGAMLSFAFTKSLLILYANEDLIAQAGFSGPPKTWDEFLEQCAAMRRIGKKGYPIVVDASTLDGMFMSRGAQLLEPDLRTTRFDQPPVVETLRFLRRLAEAEGLYQVDGQSDQDLTEFVQQNAAFFLRSSTRRPTLQKAIGEKFRWSMNLPPHDPGVEPMTVLYGGDICLFPTGEERVRAAWHFLKYFASPEVTARWAAGSGYAPLRRSAAQQPVMQAWFQEHPVNRQVFDLIPYGRSEPTPEGWQQVREVIERTAIDALLGRSGKSAEQLAAELKQEADRILTPVEQRQSRRGATYIALLAVAVVLVLAAMMRRKSAPAS